MTVETIFWATFTLLASINLYSLFELGWAILEQIP